MTVKSDVINHIIDVEGGYVNDPSDSGGETNFGVTIKVARQFGYTGSMKKMPKKVAKDIYAALYWDKLNLDDVEKLSKTVALELADTSVNMGTKRAGLFFQRSLNVLNLQERLYDDLVVDGSVGKASINAFNLYMKKRGKDGAVVLTNMLNCLQGAFYVELAERRQKDEKYIYGWFKNRI